MGKLLGRMQLFTKGERKRASQTWEGRFTNAVKSGEEHGVCVGSVQTSREPGKNVTCFLPYTSGPVARCRGGRKGL